MRKIIFQNNRYYHIYNRGVDKRKVFLDDKDYVDFIYRLRDFNNNSKFEQRIYAKKELNSFAAKELSSLPKFVEIVAYCLNPNHYHLLLEQIEDKGIERFMHKLGTGYTNSFNKKYLRSGSLFQGRYKSVKIESDEQLVYISAYTNANAEIHGISAAEDWPWSSYQDYIGIRNGNLCRKDLILKDFKDIQDYIDFSKDVARNSKEIKSELKKYCLE